EGSAVVCCGPCCVRGQRGHRDGICPCRSVPGCDRFRHSKSRPLNTTPAPDVGPSSVRQHWSVVMRPAFCHSWYRAICAFTVLLTAGDGGGGGEPTGPSGPLTLQPARPEYATFENARVTVRGASLTSSSYPGTLGGTSIRAQRTSDSTVVFQVPELAAGTHTLSMQIGRRSATAQLAVRATPPIEDPVAYIAEVDSLFLDEVEELEDWYAQADPTLG